MFGSSEKARPRTRSAKRPEQGSGGVAVLESEPRPAGRRTQELGAADLPKSQITEAESQAKLAAIRQKIGLRPGPEEKTSSQGVQIGMPAHEAPASLEQKSSSAMMADFVADPSSSEAPVVVSLSADDEARLKKQERDARRTFLMQELAEIDKQESAAHKKDAEVIAALEKDPYYQSHAQEKDQELQRILTKQSERKKEPLEELVLNSAKDLIHPEALAKELAGQFQDRWLMVGYLAEGGMGKVFEAYDLNLRKPAVLKFISTALETGMIAGKYFDRFRREAEAMAKINSPYVVKVYDADWSDKGAWYAMESIPSGDVVDQLKERGQFKVREAVAMARDVARGLRAAQEQGVIHRDLKPANILYDAERGVYKIADFGLAKNIETQNIKVLWLEAMARELLHGQESMEMVSLDKTASQRLTKIVEEIKSDEKAIKAIEESDLGLKKANQNIFQQLEELAADIPDYSVHEGFNQLLDAYKQQRVDWVVEQINRVMHSTNIDLYHDKEVSEEVKEKIISLAVELKDDPKVLDAIRANGETDFEHLAYRDDVERLTNLMPEPDIKLSRAGSLIGTPMYMAPEQWTGAITTEKVDTWALGVVLHEVLLNELPFKGKAPMDLSQKILQNQVDPINHRRPDVPKALSELISKMLSKKPEDRPSIDEVLAVLESPALAKPKPRASMGTIEGDPRLKKIGSEDITSLKIEPPPTPAPTPGVLDRIRGWFTRK